MLENFISVHNIAISAGLLVLAYILIALEKIPKVTIALVGAAIIIVGFLERISLWFVYWKNMRIILFM